MMYTFPMYRPYRTHAFSLLEMSVVLTVIALIVGSALTAQSYLRNTKLVGLMTEAQYYANAWGQFQARYTSIPGDFATASSVWPTASNGNGDGQLVPSRLSLTNTALTPVPEPAPVGTDIPEALYAFQHLALAGIIEGGFSGATAFSGGSPIVSPGVNVPKSPYDNAVYLFDRPVAGDGVVSGDTMYFDGYYGHVIRMSGKGVASVGRPAEPILTADDAYSLDSKYDDGMPATGNVLSQKSNFYNITNSAYHDPNCTSLTTDAAIYLNNSHLYAGVKLCHLFLKLGY